MKAVRHEVGPEAYIANPMTGRISAFEHDLQRRLPQLGAAVRFNRGDGRYELAELTELPAFDLPDEALAALVVLEGTFQPGSPHHDRVQSLLHHLRGCLTEERRRDLESQRVAVRIDLRQLGVRAVSPVIDQIIQRAIVQRRLLRFRYFSPIHEDRAPRTHTVEPYERYFDSVWGHHYLYAYCRQVDGPGGSEQVRAYVRYRPDRILPDGIEVLETRLPPIRPRTKRYTLVYRLAPAVARLGDVSRHFLDMRVTTEDDGSAIVQAETDDLFFAVRRLLHYGPMCRVLGGPEALREMRSIVQDMTRLYRNP